MNEQKKKLKQLSKPLGKDAWQRKNGGNLNER
jgi:hypothetical protein